MRKIRLIALLLNFYSMSSVASYECLLKLAHHDDLQKIVAEKALVIEQGSMTSGSLGTLFLETPKDNKKLSLEINGIMNGWKGEEDASFVIHRTTKQKTRSVVVGVSEIMNLKGDSKVTGWFDAYRLDIQCRVLTNRQ